MAVASACGTVTERLGAEAVAAPPSCIAVLPFSSSGSAGAAGDHMAALVANELLVSRTFAVLEPGEVVVRLAFGRGSGAVDPEVARRIGAALGVDAVLIGSVASFGARDLRAATSEQNAMVSFSARLVDVASGAILWSVSESGFARPVWPQLVHTRAELAAEAVHRALASLVEPARLRGKSSGRCGSPAESAAGGAGDGLD